MTWFQAKLIYAPARGYDQSPADTGLAFDDLRLTTTDGVSIVAWYVPHDQARGTVLFCHGNAGNIADLLYPLKLLHDMRLGVLLLDYRGFGLSDGKPTEQGTYADAEAAWQYLTADRGEPPERIVIMGRSLGGAIAIELAGRHTPAALVVESTFTSIVDIGRRMLPILPVRWMVRYKYESIDKVDRITCPKLFFHARNDTLIPLSNGRRLFAAAAEPKRFIETPGAHNTGGFTYSRDYIRQLEAFLNEVLPQR